MPPNPPVPAHSAGGTADVHTEAVVHVVKGRILLCSCGAMTEPVKGPDAMWRAFEAHQAEAAAGASSAED